MIQNTTHEEWNKNPLTAQLSNPEMGMSCGQNAAVIDCMNIVQINH